MEEVNHIDHYNAARPGTHPTAVTHKNSNNRKGPAPKPAGLDLIGLDSVYWTSLESE